MPKVSEMITENKLFTFLGRKFNKFHPRCCEAVLDSRIKISGYPLGRSASFFENYLFRLVPAPEIDFFPNPIAEMAGAARRVNPPWPESRVLPRGG